MPPIQPQQPVYYPPAPAPQPPVDLGKLREEIVGDLKTTIEGMQQQPPAPAPAPEPQQAKKYDDWGAHDQPGTVFGDVARLVDQKLAEREQQQQSTNDQVKQQQEANEKWIDDQFGQLRQAGYMPPVVNQFDGSDAGKAAETELLAYAIDLGTTNLVRAAQELQARHSRGERFDKDAKKFVPVQAQEQSNPNELFNVQEQQAPQQQPVNPQVPYQQQYPAQGYPQQYPGFPVGPQNPYMPQQQPYPPGFNAPVSSGSSYMGTQGAAPSRQMLRNASYDDLVEAFNRTQ